MSKPRSRRSPVATLLLAVLLAAAGLALSDVGGSILAAHDHAAGAEDTAAPGLVSPEQAAVLLAQLPVAAAAPGVGYDRDDLFGDQWAPVGACDVRAMVLARDLTDPRYSARTPCLVVGGILTDPYTGATISYQPGAGRIEVDHVVSLFNAWTTGAQGWDQHTRLAFANDPVNLLVVSATANQDKGAADAAHWTPDNPGFWCDYALIQITTKHTYGLWVTPAEQRALTELLTQC